MRWQKMVTTFFFSWSKSVAFFAALWLLVLKQVLLLAGGEQNGFQAVSWRWAEGISGSLAFCSCVEILWGELLALQKGDQAAALCRHEGDTVSLYGIVVYWVIAVCWIKWHLHLTALLNQPDCRCWCMDPLLKSSFLLVSSNTEVHW